MIHIGEMSLFQVSVHLHFLLNYKCISCHVITYYWGCKYV